MSSLFYYMFGFFCYLSILFWYLSRLFCYRSSLFWTLSSLICYLFGLFCFLSILFWYLSSLFCYMSSLFCYYFAFFWLLIDFARDLEARPLFSGTCPVSSQALKYCTFAALFDICPARLSDIVPAPYLLSPCYQASPVSYVCSRSVWLFQVSSYILYLTSCYCMATARLFRIPYLALSDTFHGLSRSLWYLLVWILFVLSDICPGLSVTWPAYICSKK